MDQLPRGKSFDDTDQFFDGGLKFVRWGYTAKNPRQELSVRRGDEVQIVKPAGKFWKVKLEGRTGMIPKKCFFRRITVNWPHDPEDENEIAVSKNEVVGIMEKDIGDERMCRIMKEDDSEGLVPQHCFYRRYEVYADYDRTSEEELTVRRGDVVGLVDKDSFEAFWKVYLKGKVGLLPIKCIEPPTQVHWNYEAKRPDDLTVKKGDIVSMVDFESGTDPQRVRVRVRLDDKIGYIPKKCFELPAEVYKDHNGVGNSELFVKKGDTVGIIESADDVPEGFLKVRLGEQTGIIPKECFEIPAKVIKSYKAAKVTELSVNEGDDVHVIDATAYIQVRLGRSRGEVPLTCINIDVRKIVRMLEKKRDDDTDVNDRDETSFQNNEGEMKLNVDEKALTHPLAMSDSKTAISYLKGLPVGKIVNIGLALGLTFETLRTMSTEKIHDEMVMAWLSKKDSVTTIGTPTWKSLGAVLQKLNLNQVTETIQKDNTRLDMAKLITLRWYDGNKKQCQLNIVNEGCSKWRNIGMLIGMPEGILSGVEDKRTNVARFTEVLKHWIQTGGNNNYRATWIGLQNILLDSELGNLAEMIRAAMPYLDL